MTISFFGHADFCESEGTKERLLSVLRQEVGGREVTFLLGGRGAFDEFARLCAEEYKRENPLSDLVLVTPYITLSYQKNHLSQQAERYDEILYPPIENVPPRYAISHRNRYMAVCADLVIVYLRHKWGGAYQAFLAAKCAGKQIINLADEKN